MKNFIKTIIYMLIALVIAVSVAFVDAGQIFAKSFNDVTDSDWHFYNKHGECDAAFDVRDFTRYTIDDAKNYDSTLGDNIARCKYTEHISFASAKGASVNDIEMNDLLLASDSEIVLIYQNNVQSDLCNLLGLGVSYYADKNCAGLVFVSKSKIYCFGKIVSINTGVSDYSCLNPYSRGALYGQYAMWEKYEGGAIYKAFKSYKMKVFGTVDEADNYLTTGDASGLLWQGGKEKTTYDKTVHFDNFNMDVHVSNSLDNYYIDFRYSLPDKLVGQGYSLRIDSTYRREVSNVLTGDPYSSKEYTDYQYVTLSDNPFSCRVYLKNFNSVKLGLADKNKSTEPFYNYYGVLSYYDSVYLGLTSMADAAKVGYTVSMSLLNISCKLEKSGSRGFSYNGSLDILTGANDIGSYTPDSSGNYKPNNDYRQNGYYYTKVSTDAAENTTYNYYYITNDNSRTEITKDENDNNSKSGEGIGNNSSSSSSTSGNITNNNSPTFNNENHITIEGDSINNEVNNIVDSSTSAEDNKSFIEKFLGFFQLLENNSFLGVWGKVFGWLPPGISSVITTALGISAGIGIFRFFRR